MRLKIAAAIQMTLPGVPSIYYGDEAGMTGMADPFNRAAYPWGNEDGELLSCFRTLTAVRSQNAALRAGYCRMGAVNADVFAIVRYTSEGRDAFLEEAPEAAVVLLCNRSAQVQQVTLDVSSLSEGPDAAVPFGLNGVFHNVFTQEEWMFSGDTLAASLPPYGVLLLQKRDT